ncbi:MAG TPA: peptidoglycan recognition family protein [Phnomibacter sp.]|nr:peptidoglycan recognition family protein [Phnomibacter sp.]
MRYIILFVILVSCHSPSRIPSAAVTIIPRAQWGALEAKPYRQHDPVRITVHHEGTQLLPTDDAARKINRIQAWGMGPDRNWADIPYHFLIAPNGKVYEGRAVTTVGETNTEYDPAGHLLICCLGNYEVQEVPEALLRSLIQMIAMASRTYNIPLTTLATHRDHSTQTSCPGKNLYAYFTSGYVLQEAKKLK